MNSIPISAHLVNRAADPKLARAAHQFESLLLESLIRSLDKGFALPGGDQVLGSQGFGDLGVQALASGLTAGGGLGISAVVLRNLMKTEAKHHPSKAAK
jgi:Rod binding domain-containing protein